MKGNEERDQTRPFNETAKQRGTWNLAAGILEPSNSSVSPFQNEETRSELAINQKNIWSQTASALRANSQGLAFSSSSSL